MLMTKKNIFVLILLAFFTVSFQGGFKQEQLKYARVRDAYKTTESQVKTRLDTLKLSTGQLEIYIRAFKLDKKLELWGKNKSQKTYVLIKTFDICAISGEVGPKRKEGDMQIPEGFYYINRFNPVSNFHLSLGLNYPNQSDRIFSDQQHPGGDIYIHGSCVTIGCMPILDEYIKELYIYCTEARNNGQTKIPVTVFPCYPDGEKFAHIKTQFAEKANTLLLWDELSLAYQSFQQTKQLPVISFLTNGRHLVK